MSPIQPEAFLHYAAYVLLAAGMTIVFLLVYTRLTPHDELALIRNGKSAASLSLGGALLGFIMTLASSIMHTQSYVQFIIWSVAALAVQLLVYLVLSLLLKDIPQQLEKDNVAFGGLVGAVSLAMGVINAACIY
ncbi:DUF350 domain-containing protein [Massilia sp. W12]|uniref:DUF350 domain-containing protein n=1 Tax=Massilia sp. W12 TaxID=3126507 RepID=UPI0030CF99A8